MNLYELKENRIMRPKTFSAMLSNLLYERRFGPYFIEPVIAGLDPVDNQPYVCNMDLVSYLYCRLKCPDIQKLQKKPIVKSNNIVVNKMRQNKIIVYNVSRKS